MTNPHARDWTPEQAREMGAKNNHLKKYQFTKENAAEMGRRGGIKSGENYRRKKSFQKVAQELLAARLPDEAEEIQKMAKKAGIEDCDYRTAMLLAQISRAIARKDTNAFEAVRDTAGEKPIDKKQIIEPVTITDDLCDSQN